MKSSNFAANIKEMDMKKLMIPIALLLLVACGQKSEKASENQETQEVQEETPQGPLAQIEFPEGKSHDFGIYYEREVKECDFLVRNPGKVPLVISQVETFCGCTNATDIKKPILEGQTDTIHVWYSGNGFVEGYFAKHIRLHANIEKGFIDLKICGAYYDSNQ